jgi:hypothetical protein
VTVNALHPGLVNTDFGDVGGVVGFGWFFVRHSGIAPSEGARTPIYCASAPELAGVTGGYFRRGRVAQPDIRTNDAVLRSRLWDFSERMLALSNA